MRLLRVISVAAVSLLVLSASAYGSESPRKEVSAKDFNPRNFDRSTLIDNEWLPLKPGTQYVYEGSTLEGRKRVPHRVVFTVTDLTKVIDGVRALVIWDRDFNSEGHLIEPELTFFAQDNDGNVWHLGQYRETYDEKGEFVGGRVWVSGLEGARAGIMMKAVPRLGTPAYSEGYAPPPFYWADFAKVDKMGQKACVPFRCYEDVLVTDEFDKFEPGAHQLKFYARGVGNVRVGWRGGNDPEKETLVLAKVVQLSGAALTKVRAKALELETRANTYSLTRPAERTLGAEGR